MKVIAGTNSIIEATLMGDSMTTNRVKVFLASSSVAMVKRTAALPDIAYYTVTQVTGGVTYSYEYTPDIDYSLRLSLRKWYDRAYQNADLQVTILFSIVRALLIEQLCKTPQQGGCQRINKPHFL